MNEYTNEWAREDKTKCLEKYIPALENRIINIRMMVMMKINDSDHKTTTSSGFLYQSLQ